MRVGAGALVVLLLVALACAILISAMSPAGSAEVLGSPLRTGQGEVGEPGGDGQGEADPRTDPLGVPGTGMETPVEPPPASTYFVHVLGAVSRPGLYEVDDAARVIDAIAAAGGLADTADTTRVNLARRVGDGEQLYVPAVGEQVPPGLDPPPSMAGGASGTPAGESPGVVNLNSATEEDLDTLPRIGPALADRILEWRETNGRFTSVEDLLSVPGIGDKIVEGLRPMVTV